MIKCKSVVMIFFLYHIFAKWKLQWAQLPRSFVSKSRANNSWKTLITESEPVYGLHGGFSLTFDPFKAERLHQCRGEKKIGVSG